MNWIVLKNVMELSAEQMANYDIGHEVSNPPASNGGSKDNNRAVQPLNGREVYIVTQVK